MTPAQDRFVEKLRAALADGAFVKTTLSDPRDAGPGLRNVYARLVELRDGRRLSLVWRYATRDVTKNFEIDAGVKELDRLVGADFRKAHLFTTTGDWRLDSKRGTLKASRPAFAVAPPVAHDREKVRAVGDAPFLTALGVTNVSGEARPGMAGKLRQIERYTELFSHLIEASPLRDARSLRVVDLGAGKGYLTFAIQGFLRERGIEAIVTGVESRQDLVDTTNRVAGDLGCAGLSFVRGEIGDYTPPEPPDVLIALHACDTATDDALHLGVRSGAQLLIAAPCCHKEIRAQLTPPEILGEVLRHGILAEREAELLTDGLRALLLEIHGFDAKVFEFISPEHTAKNLMIAAHRREEPRDPALQRVRLRELLECYGIRNQRLASLLGELE